MNLTKMIPLRNFKTLSVISILLLIAFSSFAQEIKTVKINVGLIYPISSNGNHAPLDTNHLSINLIAGISASEMGLAIAGISNVVRNDTFGAQIAGFSNHVGKNAKGALIAGFANTYRQNDGVALAGFANIAHGDVKGAQLAGFANVAKAVKGSQLAGFVNVATNVSASQLAGFANIAKKLKGSQLAGFANIAGNVSASQLAGFINVAKDVNGSQLGGFINIARKVKGAQFSGFINIAEESDCPFGLLNFIKKGEKSIGLSMDELETGLLSFRSGGKTTYGILAAGYNFRNKDEVYAFEAGFGAHLRFSNSFRVNVELTAATLESFKDGEYFRSALKLLPALKLTNHIELFGGPSLNLITTNTIEGNQLHTDHLKSWRNNWSDYTQYLTMSYGGGINFIF